MKSNNCLKHNKISIQVHITVYMVVLITRSWIKMTFSIKLVLILNKIIIIIQKTYTKLINTIVKTDTIV